MDRKLTPLKISPERLKGLNEGEYEAKNLMETLAVDFKVLLSHCFPTLDLSTFDNDAKITKKMRQAADLLYQTFGSEVFDTLQTHKSDTLRGIACCLINHKNNPFPTLLEKALPLADDTNSGVREWAWMGLRNHFSPDHIPLLLPLTTHSSDRIRRFVSELTRPRGVWCSHIRELRQEPWKGLPLLSPLKADPALYVQKSVGNWLNDASKDHPSWVQDLCQQWTHESQTLATDYICRRALRTIRKKQA